MWTFFALMLVARPVCVLLHELGHGITALLVTHGKVKLYVGSYGDPIRSLRATFGRLEVFVTGTVFLLPLGLCVPESKNVPIWRQFLVTLMGPVSSFIFGALCMYLSLGVDAVTESAGLLFFIALLAFLDFFVNII